MLQLQHENGISANEANLKSIAQVSSFGEYVNVNRLIICFGEYVNVNRLIICFGEYVNVNRLIICFGEYVNVNRLIICFTVFRLKQNRFCYGL